METCSALLAFCVENSPVSGEFPAQRPVTRSFDVLFDLRLNKWLNKQSQGWWFVTPSCPLWRHYNEIMVSWVEGVRDRVRVRWVLASNYRLHLIWFLGIVIHYSYYCKCDGCNNLEIITCVMYGGVEGPPHIFFRHHAISYGWHSNSSVGDSNYCYVIRRTY